MPELPDITIYIEALEERLLNQPLQKVRLTSPFLLRSVAPPVQSAEGKKIIAFHRIGKRIVFELEDQLFLARLSQAIGISAILTRVEACKAA